MLKQAKDTIVCQNMDTHHGLRAFGKIVSIKPAFPKGGIIATVRIEDLRASQGHEQKKGWTTAHPQSVFNIHATPRLREHNVFLHTKITHSVLLRRSRAYFNHGSTNVPSLCLFILEFYVPANALRPIVKLPKFTSEILNLLRKLHRWGTHPFSNAI